jgi:predicted outer membrane repeat protein
MITNHAAASRPLATIGSSQLRQRMRLGLGCLVLGVLAAASPALEVTNLQDSGPGSLRNACGSKNVVFSSALAGKTITLASRIEIRSDTVIDATAAPGVVISGGGRTRLFFVGMKAKVTFAGLTLAEGANIDTDKARGINAGGGAIYGDQVSEVTIVGCSFRKNRVTLVEGGGSAVFMSYHSKLVMSDCSFEDNEATGGGERGGTVTLATDTTSLIRRSRFTGNKGFTGGINNLLGTMTVEDCVFTSNEGTNVGGAIYSDGASEKTDDDKGGVLTVTRSRFVGNHSPGLGGACYLFMYHLDRLLVDRCVFDGNSGDHGGAIASGNGIMEIVDSAFLRNTATYGAAFWSSGSKRPGECPLTVRNTLFALNEAKKGTCGAVSTETTDLVRLERCTFWKNLGGGGSVLQLWKKEGKASFSGCIVAENQTPLWTSGITPATEGVNVIWPGSDGLPRSDSVAHLDPQLEAGPLADDQIPQVLPRAPGLVGKIGAVSVELTPPGRKSTAKAKPAAPPRPAATPQPAAGALSKAIAAQPTATTRGAAVAALRGWLVGAGVGTSGSLPSFEEIVVKGGDERSLRFASGNGTEQSLPWALIDDQALLRLARSGLGAAAPTVRAAWIALACHLDRPRPEIRTELEALRSADPERFAVYTAILASVDTAPSAPASPPAPTSPTSPTAY